ncbi:uncharacterized protein [Rutidosis leptorrhynchoides]|uniref:uncharacterized protein n=1 Tax=Rutidosis leptorrhynchoides TaxID=125765 RepID=UPI003A9A053C
MESLSKNKRSRPDSDVSDSNSTESKRIRPDLLDALEDSEALITNPKLELFIKSFENEISNSGRDSVAGDFQPDLGFLFEASDDELGLPSANITPVESEKKEDVIESVELDSFEYGLDYTGGDFGVNTCNDDDEYVKLDGVFECTNVELGSPDRSLVPDTLPAQ